MTSVPSENILKLRELTEKMTNTAYESEVIDLVKEIISDGVDDAVKAKTDKTKLKCYENICYKITNILTSIKK